MPPNARLSLIIWQLLFLQLPVFALTAPVLYSEALIEAGSFAMI
jgi:hypothetical protein